jgi:hypothetical protein
MFWGQIPLLMLFGTVFVFSAIGMYRGLKWASVMMLSLLIYACFVDFYDYWRFVQDQIMRSNGRVVSRADFWSPWDNSWIVYWALLIATNVWFLCFSHSRGLFRR